LPIFRNSYTTATFFLGGKKVKAPKINYMKQYRKKDLNFTEKVAFFILT
jgi:hypothetical protein